MKNYHFNFRSKYYPHLIAVPSKSYLLKCDYCVYYRNRIDCSYEHCGFHKISTIYIDKQNRTI